MVISPCNSIRRSVKNGRLLQIAGTLLGVIILCSCEEYPPYASGMYPRAAPAGWWHGEDASGPPKIVVHIGEQKADSTPPGHYTVLSKDADHVSTVFGDYVDDYGNVVRSNIDARKDSRPKGSHFDGARMPYAMFFRGGYAMHQGYVPPFAASHGCIRVPKDMARPFFQNAPVGTPVTVTE